MTRTHNPLSEQQETVRLNKSSLLLSLILCRVPRELSNYRHEYIIVYVTVRTLEQRTTDYSTHFHYQSTS